MPVRYVLYSAILTSTFVIFGILFVVKPEVAGPHEPILAIAIGAVAVVVAVVSFVLPGIVLKASVKQLGLETRPAPSFGDLPAGTLVFANPAGARARAAASLQSAMIVRIALREAIALFGFVLGILGFGLPIVLPFFVLAWVLLALAFPSDGSMDRQLEKAAGAKLGAG